VKNLQDEMFGVRAVVDARQMQLQEAMARLDLQEAAMQTLKEEIHGQARRSVEDLSAELGRRVVALERRQDDALEAARAAAACTPGAEDLRRLSDELDQRVRSIEAVASVARVEELGQRIGALERASQSAGAEDLAGLRSELGQRLGALESASQAASAEALALRRSIEGVRAAVGGLEAALGSSEVTPQGVAGWASDVSDMSARLVKMQHQVGSLDRILGEVQAAAEASLESDPSGEPLAQRVGDLVQTLETVVPHMQSQQQSIDKNSSDIEELRSWWLGQPRPPLPRADVPCAAWQPSHPAAEPLSASGSPTASTVTWPRGA